MKNKNLKNKKTWLLTGVTAIVLLLSHNCWAKSALETRLERLEAIVENQLTVQDLNALDSFKQQLQEMRGIMEEYQHELELLQQRQDALFKETEDLRLGKNGRARTKQSSWRPSALNSLRTRLAAMRESDSAKADVAVDKTTNANLTVEDNADEIAGVKARQAPSEQESYEIAHNLINLKKYTEAQTTLQDFLWRFPESKEVANVYYWLGEIYLSYWHEDKTDLLPLEKAINSFKTVVENYPQHGKAVDCLLKLGLTEIERKNWDVAKGYLEDITQQYPESSRAKIAHARLQGLQDRGL